jgi:hypothetical protein
MKTTCRFFLRITFFIVVIFSVSFNFQACGPRTTPTDSDTLDTIGTKVVSDNSVAEIISSVQNPVEMSSLLQKSGVIFAQDLLNKTENISRYTSSIKKALNLGIYGTDLVHMNIYGKTVSSLLYLKNIQDLANDLKIGQFFDYETLNRLSQNDKNKDSVLYITSSGFDKMSNFLIQQKRSNIAILISYGTWMETLYLATNIEKVSNKQAVYDRIGEQKKVMDNIVLLLKSYEKDPNYKEIYLDALALKKEFDKVKITYDYKEPTTKEVNGALIVIDNSTSTININEEIIDSIKKQVKIIRDKLVS